MVLPNSRPAGQLLQILMGDLHMNKPVIKTIFLSMVLFSIGGTSSLFSKSVASDNQHQQLMAEVEAMVTAKISKEELAQIRDIEVEIAQADIATRDALRAQILAKFDETELADIRAKGAEIIATFDADLAEINAGLRKLDKELLDYRHAREKFVDECIDEICRNPFSIENLVKNGDADLLDCLFQNGLENKINQSWYLFRPRMSELLELAKQHNQKSVVAVLRPYADKERKEQFYLDIIPPVAYFALVSLWFLLGGSYTFGA